MSGSGPPARSQDTAGSTGSTPTEGHGAILSALDAETTALVRLAAVLAGGGEAQVDAALRAVGSAEASARVRAEWVEELLLQTYLFAGFPRALNGMRAWRLLTGRPAPAEDAAARPSAAWAGDGART